MTPCACVGGAERADKRVVVYNCTQHDCMLRVKIGPSLLDGLRKLLHPVGALGAREVIEEAFFLFFFFLFFCKECHCTTQYIQIYHHRNTTQRIFSA